jgi:hypothetical protein
MDVHRNAAALIPDRNRAVHVNRHVDAVAMARQVFVHRIVEHFRNAMVQGPLVRAADVHPRLLANRFQPFQFAEF